MFNDVSTATFGDEKEDKEMIIEEDNGAEENGAEPERECQRRLEKLKTELEDCRREKNEYLAGWQRAKADLINGRRDFQTEREKIIRFAGAELLNELLPTADSFESALSKDNNGGNWRTGIEQVQRGLLAVFKRFGLEPFGKQGERFDPNRHQAVGRAAVSRAEEDGIVIKVNKQGYLLHDSVLRPAEVIVGGLDVVDVDDREKKLN